MAATKTTKMKMTKTTSDPSVEDAQAILRRPYGRSVFPEDDGSYRGEILEFPGCIAVGATAAEALSNLEEVAESWLLSALAHGHVIPSPVSVDSDYSGRLVLRMPRTLHKKAAWAAEQEGVSLNQFIVASLAESVGERRAASLVLSTTTHNHQWHLMSSAIARETNSTSTLVSYKVDSSFLQT